MLIHKSFSELSVQQWNNLLQSSLTTSFFQTPECYSFYASLFFMKPFVYGVSENDKLVGLLCGYLIADGNPVKQFFSRRAIIPGGVLLDPEISSIALKELLKFTARELTKEAIYIEIRNYNDYSFYRPNFEKAAYSYLPHLNFHVATADVETALKQLSTTKRRDLKLSKKEGAEWLETKDKDDLKTYYDLLHQLYKTRIKTPLFPVEFFEQLIQNDFGKLFVVKYQNQIIGGSVCVSLSENTMYEWFVCGLVGQMKNVFPSTLATWAAIEYAANNGFKRFDMMGAGKPDEGYGVRDFKSKFGGELVEHGRFLYVCKPILYSLGKYIIQKLKKRK